MPSFSNADNIPGGFAGTTPMAVEPTPAQSQQSLRQQGAMPSSGFYPGPVGTSGHLGVPTQQQYQPANLAGLDIGQMGMPAIPTTSGQNGMYTSSSPQQNGSGASDFSLDEEHLPTDQHQRPGNSRRANGKLHARDTKTKRNPKQQMQNKQAQQRYRSTSYLYWPQSPCARQELNEMVMLPGLTCLAGAEKLSCFTGNEGNKSLWRWSRPLTPWQRKQKT